MNENDDISLVVRKYVITENRLTFLEHFRKMCEIYLPALAQYGRLRPNSSQRGRNLCSAVGRRQRFFIL